MVSLFNSWHVPSTMHFRNQFCYSCVPNWWKLGLFQYGRIGNTTRIPECNGIFNIIGSQMSLWNALVIWVEEAVRMSIYRSEIICFEKWHRYWKPKSTTATIGGSIGFLRLTLDGIENIPIANQIKQIHWFQSKDHLVATLFNVRSCQDCCAFFHFLQKWWGGCIK